MKTNETFCIVPESFIQSPTFALAAKTYTYMNVRN